MHCLNSFETPICKENQIKMNYFGVLYLIEALDTDLPLTKYMYIKH